MSRKDTICLPREGGDCRGKKFFAPTKPGSPLSRGRQRGWFFMIALCLLIFFVAGPSFVLADTGADDTLEAYLDQLYKTGDFVEEDFEDFEDFENLMYLAQPKFQITGDDTSTEDNSTSDNSTSDNSSSESSSDSSSSDSSSSTTEGKPEIICSLHRGIDSGEKSQLVLFAATMMLLLLIRRRFAQ